MITRLRLNFGTRALQVVTLALAACFSVGAPAVSSHFKDPEHRMIHSCCWSQILVDCNCAESLAPLGVRGGLSSAIAGGRSGRKILSWFAAEYRAVVVAASTTQGFDLMAWIAPLAVLGAALLGTTLLVRRLFVSPL